MIKGARRESVKMEEKREKEVRKKEVDCFGLIAASLGPCVALVIISQRLTKRSAFVKK